MIILHVLWQHGNLHVWGEQPAECMPAPLVSDLPEMSPFDAGRKLLGKALSTLLWDKTLNPDFALTTVTLPAWHKALNLPCPSSEFLADKLMPHCNKPSSAHLHAPDKGSWRITTVKLTPQQGLTLLGICQKYQIAPGLFIGNDLLACARIFNYVGSLVARGKFLPGIKKNDAQTFYALWEPALDRMELQHARQLLNLLPPVIAAAGKTEFPGWEIVATLTNQLVRISLHTTLTQAYAKRGEFYSVHDAWLAALRSDNPLIRWESHDDLIELQSAVTKWRQPVEGGASYCFTLSFTLQAPLTADQKWFLLVRVSDQNQDEIDLHQLVDSHTPTSANLREDILISLGQAALLFHPLKHADYHADNFGVTLTNSETAAFLTVYAPILESAGYMIVLPEWWEGAEINSLTLEAEILPGKDASAQTDMLQEQVSVKWHVLFNDKPVTSEELESTDFDDSPLVFLHNRWTLIDNRQKQEALRILRNQQSAKTMPVQDIMQMMLGVKSQLNTLPLVHVGGSGWLGNRLEQVQNSERVALLPTPTGFSGTLRPYQVHGFSWLSLLRTMGLGACLADDMGLGKTIQALAFLQQEKNIRGKTKPTLLAAPMSVLVNWMREAERFTPDLRCYLHHGAARLSGMELRDAIANSDVVITSFHLLYRDYAELRQVAWGVIILDEAQNIKNPGTRQAQAARALQAEHRIALTGTPLENNVGELWSIMDFLNPGTFGSRSDFRREFFQPIHVQGDPLARIRLRQIMSPFILRRLKTDKQIISDLPEKQENKVQCTLTREQARLYQDVLQSFEQELPLLTGIDRRGQILAVLTKLKQICNHPLNYLTDTRGLAHRSGKLARLEEMLEMAFTAGESALVFTQYAEMGHLLRQRLCEVFAIEMPFLHGGLSLKERDQLVSEFQGSRTPQAFILSLKAGGTGLNLTRASQVFHYDRWWNPAVENQATDRAFRIGQQRNVMVHAFVCSGTLEERINTILQQKTALSNEVVASDSAFLTEMSNAELTQILKLSIESAALAVEQEEGEV